MAEARGCGGGKQFETGKKARGDGHSLGVEATVGKGESGMRSAKRSAAVCGWRNSPQSSVPSCLPPPPPSSDGRAGWNCASFHFLL